MKPSIVYGENVQQTLQFAQSGNAEVAIVALSLAMTSDGRQLHDRSTRAARAARSGARGVRQRPARRGRQATSRRSSARRTGRAIIRTLRLRAPGRAAALRDNVALALDWRPLVLSFQVAASPRCSAGVLGIALGRAARAHASPGAICSTCIVTAPMVLPPTVLGYYVLVALGRRSVDRPGVRGADRLADRLHADGRGGRGDDRRAAARREERARGARGRRPHARARRAHARRGPRCARSSPCSCRSRRAASSPALMLGVRALARRLRRDAHGRRATSRARRRPRRSPSTTRSRRTARTRPRAWSSS